MHEGMREGTVHPTVSPLSDAHLTLEPDAECCTGGCYGTGRRKGGRHALLDVVAATAFLLEMWRRLVVRLPNVVVQLFDLSATGHEVQFLVHLLVGGHRLRPDLGALLPGHFLVLHQYAGG